MKSDIYAHDLQIISAMQRMAFIRLKERYDVTEKTLNALMVADLVCNERGYFTIKELCFFMGYSKKSTVEMNVLKRKMIKENYFGFDRTPRAWKEEWYVITSKGKQVVRFYMRQMAAVTEQCSKWFSTHPPTAARLIA